MKLPVLFDEVEATSPVEAVLSTIEPMAPRGEVYLPDGGEGSEEVALVLWHALNGLTHAAATGASAPAISLEGLSPAALRLLEGTLGVGEVSIHVRGNHLYDCVETVLPGLWRVRTRSDVAAIADHLEVADVPAVVRAACRGGTQTELPVTEPPPGAMNVMPLLAELRERMQAPPGPVNHVVNFTLFPMSEVDMAFLQDRLGRGPVEAESRGYGKCRVMLTSRRNVWSVQFFNAMGTVILDTLEVGDVPVALRAASTDFEDSALRLSELLAQRPAPVTPAS